MSRAAATLFALTILLSAFLLFAVQPIIARFILPWFGGAAAVWTTCLLFFQVVLLGGYAYAHLLANRSSPRTQAIVHSTLLLACAALLPIVPAAQLAPTGNEDPTFRILLVLAASVGLPYFALSATAPLVQHWFARRFPSASVYRLYALSNAGSLAALISYPFLIEPLLTRRTQSLGWSWLFALYAALGAGCALLAARSAPLTQTRATEDGPPLTGSASILVLMLTALASALLLATTNTICQDIAPFPFLWVLPLTLYLIAFIVCFEHPRAYHRGIILPTTALATFAAAAGLLNWRYRFPLSAQVVILGITLLLCCMVCLGETVRLRPATRHLTRYYLLVSLGGVAGAILVALLAPLLFHRFVELHIGLLAVWILALWVLLVDPASRMRGFRKPGLWLTSIIALPCLALLLYYDATLYSPSLVHVSRSFYGVMEITEDRLSNPRLAHRELIHNGTTHGMQFMHEEFRRKPTSYYHEKSGVGVVMRRFRAEGPRRIGLVGLGTGTLAAYGKAGDDFTFYELDPDVAAVARSHFTYLADTPATTRVIMGDARLSLARQENQNYDVIVLDAFSGDAVPFHLLTVEAFALYRRHLSPGGVIAIHLSNRHLHLLLPAWNVATHHGMRAALFHITRDDTPYASEWLLVTEDVQFLRSLQDEPTLRKGKAPEMPPWTDDHAPLFPIMRRQFKR